MDIRNLCNFCDNVVTVNFWTNTADIGNYSRRQFICRCKVLGIDIGGMITESCPEFTEIWHSYIIEKSREGMTAFLSDPKPKKVLSDEIKLLERDY